MFFAIAFFGAAAAFAQTTAFTYQGRLTDTGLAANGNYDFQFALYDSLTSGNQIGSTSAQSGVAVSDGVFTVQLDFGANAFPGAARYLEIRVQPAGGNGFTTLAPRQQITSTPYAMRSLSAATGDSLSSACVACVSDTQINSVAGSKVNGTIPVASVPAGSSSYIQNTTSQQASSSFNISGNGTVGGTLTGNTVSATTQYNIGGNRALSSNSTLANTFVGYNAGSLTTTSAHNSFFGNLAGSLTNGSGTDGTDNSFFGSLAGSQ